MRMRGAFVTGEGGQSSLTELQNSSKISGYGSIGADFNWTAFPTNAGYLKITNTPPARSRRMSAAGRSRSRQHCPRSIRS